jgi:hypothetical protein
VRGRREGISEAPAHQPHSQQESQQLVAGAAEKKSRQAEQQEGTLVPELQSAVENWVGRRRAGRHAPPPPPPPSLPCERHVKEPRGSTAMMATATDDRRQRAPWRQRARPGDQATGPGRGPAGQISGRMGAAGADTCKGSPRESLFLLYSIEVEFSVALVGLNISSRRHQIMLSYHTKSHSPLDPVYKLR